MCLGETPALLVVLLRVKEAEAHRKLVPGLVLPGFPKLETSNWLGTGRWVERLVGEEVGKVGRLVGVESPLTSHQPRLIKLGPRLPGKRWDEAVDLLRQERPIFHRNLKRLKAELKSL